MPGYEKWESDYNPAETGLLYVDHCVGNVGWNKMNETVQWYQDVMGFVNILSFDDKQINTEYSALMSKVMSNGNGYVKFPINEPAEGKRNLKLRNILNFMRAKVCSMRHWQRRILYVRCVNLNPEGLNF
ncbi:VOC family protein [Sphingobacterium sp. E70]|nr:VOC family protein [Sphingobacterium sp. E70]ULT26369.1 VOC family protein [Sphingobacterium sp. E70]